MNRRVRKFISALSLQMVVYWELYSFFFASWELYSFAVELWYAVCVRSIAEVCLSSSV